MGSLKKKRIPAVSSYKAVLRDPRLSDGPYRTLMEMKARSVDRIVTVRMNLLAEVRGITRQTLLQHIKQLVALRLISIKRNSKRGMMDAHTYYIEDEHFARHLAKAPRCKKNLTPVPSVIDITHVQRVSPPNVISLEQAKAAMKRAEM